MRDRCGSAKWWPVSDKRKANDVAVVVRVLGQKSRRDAKGVIQLATNWWEQRVEEGGGGHCCVFRPSWMRFPPSGLDFTCVRGRDGQKRAALCSLGEWVTLGGPISAAAVVTDGWTSGTSAAESLSLASRLECCGWWCNIRSAEGGGNVEAASLRVCSDFFVRLSRRELGSLLGRCCGPDRPVHDRRWAF
jgi:hypothetical protein